MFTDRLQEALGDILEDGDGEDWVGALFLEIVGVPIIRHWFLYFF